MLNIFFGEIPEERFPNYVYNTYDKDIIINLRHIMDFGDKPFEIRIMNNDIVVHNMQEYVLYAGLFL